MWTSTRPLEHQSVQPLASAPPIASTEHRQEGCVARRAAAQRSGLRRPSSRTGQRAALLGPASPPQSASPQRPHSEIDRVTLAAVTFQYPSRCRDVSPTFVKRTQSLSKVCMRELNCAIRTEPKGRARTRHPQVPCLPSLSSERPLPLLQRELTRFYQHGATGLAVLARASRPALFRAARRAFAA